MWEALTKVQVYILCVGSEHHGNMLKSRSHEASTNLLTQLLISGIMVFILLYFIFLITAQDEKSDEI